MRNLLSTEGLTVVKKHQKGGYIIFPKAWLGGEARAELVYTEDMKHWDKDKIRVIERTVRKSGDSGAFTVPPYWVDRKVRITLIKQP